VWPRHRALARRWLITVTSILLVLSLPIVANPIVDALPQAARLDDAGSIVTLIVLDGDNRRGRVRETQRVWAAERPQIVYVLGGPWVVEALVEVGLPQERIRLVQGPENTRAQMEWIQRYIAAHASERVAVIASRLHMPRVEALTRSMRLPVMLITSPIDTEPARTGIWTLVPTYIALRASRDAIYEHAALAYYEWRDWIALKPG
jgi:uncharacterized SAM-binding protein YcdF (DUF218 family)